MTTGIEFRLKNIEDTLEKILLLLNDNEKWLVTKVALHQQKIEDIPSPATIKWYASAGGALVSGIGIITYVIHQSIKNATVDQKGAVQLEDSTASTSIIKAATPKSVKDFMEQNIRNIK